MATQLDVISQLATLLGGSRQTSTADTSALRSVLAQLQQQNTPEGQQAQLQALFQQAAGQIPGLQGAYSNAVGARRGGNSAVQGALNKLMSQVTLAGQANQTANLNAQAQAAGALANATRGTTTGTNLGGAAKNLLLLQGLSKGRKLLGDDEFSVDGIMSSLGFGPTASTANGPNITGLTDTGDSSLGGDFLQGNGMDFNSAPGASLDLGSLLGNDTPTFSLDNVDMGFDFGASGNAAGADIGSGGLMDDLFEFGVFADGGLVGRDGQAPKGGDEEMAEERAQAKFDPGFTDNVALDLLRNLMPAFADGGAVDVYAPGARRSNAQSVNPTAPTRMNATNMAAAPSAPAGGISLSDIGGSGSLGPVGTPGAGGMPQDARDMLGTFGKVNSVLGLAGAPNIPGLGMMSGILGADTNEQAARAFGVATLSLANPVLGLLANAMLPSPPLSENQAVASLNAANPAPGYDTATLPTEADIDTTDVAPSDFGGRGGSGGFGGVNNSAGSGEGQGSNGSVNGFGGTRMAADGGKIKGPGTGVSDSIPAMLSNGEYVISKDVVDAVGVEFFDALQASLHTPAAAQRSR